MKNLLPAIDLVAHNALAVLLTAPLLILISQIIVAVILRIAARILRSSIFEGVSVEDRAALRKRVQRRALLIVLILSALLLVGAVVASYRGLRAIDLAKGALAWMRGQDFAALRMRLFKVLAIAVAAYVVDAIARALVTALGKGLSVWNRLSTQHEALPEVVKRVRAALRALIVLAAVSLSTRTIELPEEAQRTLRIALDVAAAYYVARAASRVWHLVTEVFFGLADRLAELTGVLKALANLNHLTRITKRTGDYFIYVGAATWVAGEVAPDTWYYSVGQIGLRVIVIFYASRLLVEVCVLLVQELFMGKSEEHTEGDLQRRRTLLPVITGFLRYGIYFTGLVMGLKEASIDPTPLLAGAGVLGVAIGFGAQTFVGDIVAGLFILLEDLVLVGDIVEIGGINGVVEEIGVRITKIRDDNGVLHAIPNGEVRKVANHSRDYVNIVVDVHVPYEEDPRRVRALLALWTEKILDEEGAKRGPVNVDVEELTEASVLLRIIASVPPGKDKDLSGLVRGRVIEELQAAKVGAPRLRRAVIVDSTLRVGSPPGQEVEEEAEGPPNPFKPEASDE